MIRNYMRSLRILHSFLACASFFLLGGASRAASPVVMKVLVLAGASTEKSYQSITTVLDQIGVPRQSIVLNSIQPDASGNRLSQVALSDPTTGRGLYQGIILTDSSFAACGSSCLSQADWTKLN